MQLVLHREMTAGGNTLGKLNMDGEFFCHTLEDPVRERDGLPVPMWKVPGRTAIPAGNYRVVITFSPRFKVDLPLLLNVPGFNGVRIHAGNDNQHTEGCILVGLGRAQLDDDEGVEITQSRLALDKLMKALERAFDDEELVHITIINPPEHTA